MSIDEKLLGLDFGTLRTLQFVFELGSFSKAADKLGQTQSNISYTINRLRDCFGDPLFVREGRKMIPTDRCRLIATHAFGLLETFQGLASQQEFDPLNAIGTVRLACNHYERMTILPELIRRIRLQAPGIKLHVLNSLASGEEQIKRGESDILLGPLQFGGEKIYKRRIRTDRYVLIMSKNNPLANEKLTLKHMEQARLITLNLSTHWRPMYFSSFELAGLNIEPSIELSEYGNIGAYVKDSDLVAIVPSLLANQFGPEIKQKDLPLDVPIEIDMFWSERTHQSALHQWLRNLIFRICR